MLASPKQNPQTNVVNRTAAEEWAANFLWGRSEKDEIRGDIIETLLNYSFGFNEGLLGWE